MDIFFYVMPSLIIAGALAVAVRVVGRSLQLRSNWNSGLTAEARCLRAYARTRRDQGAQVTRTTLHHVYEFVTRDGRAVRFEEANGPGTTVEGDIATVHYTRDRPERATAHAPAPGKALVGMAGVLMLLAVVIAFCVAFMASYAEVFAGRDLFGVTP
ncbi:MAG: DUF3592 domain-containing protein [Streptomyces sp.]|jgi:hypothetical protein|nr:DUF3592 domain-containing protein [Streptomyces sp.]